MVGHIEMAIMTAKTKIVNIVLYHSKMINNFIFLSFEKTKESNRYLWHNSTFLIKKKDRSLCMKWPYAYSLQWGVQNMVSLLKLFLRAFFLNSKFLELCSLSS